MYLKIIVCVKQVPDTNEIKIDPVRKTLLREGVPSIINHDDANAMEEALRLKDHYPDTHITVVTMGPPQAKDILLECLAMGADEAVLVCDKALGGSDTWATSNALAATIGKLGACDIIFAGRQAIDGDTAQVGPQLAEKLNLPQVTYVSEFNFDEDTRKIVVKRDMEDGYELIGISLPCVLTTIKELNTPRYMSVSGIFKSTTKEIPVWGVNELAIDPNLVGLDASPTKVYRSFTPVSKGTGIMISGNSEKELSRALLIQLMEKHVI